MPCLTEEEDIFQSWALTSILQAIVPLPNNVGDIKDYWVVLERSEVEERGLRTKEDEWWETRKRGMRNEGAGGKEESRCEGMGLGRR
jgi:hypothetical protein